MNPIERVSDAVHLAGRDLTLEDYSQFLLDAALPRARTPSSSAEASTGAKTMARVGGRTLAISGGDRPDMPLVSVSFVDTEHAPRTKGVP